MISVAVAGIAHPHASYIFDELAHHEQVRLVAIAEPDMAIQQEYAQRYDVPGYADHRELLAQHQPDVVGIAGIFGERGAVVADALRAGAHVVADKPLCTRLSELDEIERAAAASGRMVSLLLEKRHYPAALAARELYESGVLGEIALVASTGPHKLNRETRPDWFFRRESYGGILADLAVHDIDLVLRFSGATSGSVVGLCGNRGVPDRPEFTDHGALLLHAGATTATIDAHFMGPQASPLHGDYHMRLTGSGGTAEIAFARDELVVATHDRPPWTPKLPAGLRPAQDFFTALAGGRAPDVDTAASVLATRIALLAQDSADAGGQPREWTSR